MLISSTYAAMNLLQTTNNSHADSPTMVVDNINAGIMDADSISPEDESDVAMDLMEHNAFACEPTEHGGIAFHLLRTMANLVIC